MNSYNYLGFFTKLPRSSRRFVFQLLYSCFGFIKQKTTPATPLTKMYFVFRGFKRGLDWRDTDECAVVKDGALYITTKYLENGKYGSGYYSACISTSELKEFTYGYFEARCICPPACGLWSAFWLQSPTMTTVTGDGKNGAEIDVMESPFYDDPSMPDRCKGTTQHTVHIDGYASEHKSKTSAYYKVDGMFDTFHTYGVLWTSEKYVFYIDGKKTHETDFGVSQSPEYLILSVEIAGENANPDNPANRVSWSGDVQDNADGVLPVNFVIDYVRVYAFNA